MMKHLYRFPLTLGLLLTLAGCGTQMKISKVDPTSGYFPSTKKATVVTSMQIDLDAHKALIVTGPSEFQQQQLKNIQYFGEVITFEELEKRIIRANLTEKVPSLRERVGVHNAAKHYQPFLWLRYESRAPKKGEFHSRGQFILTNPITFEDYFVTETALDRDWTGVTDNSNWYPMYNALIDFIKANSRTYRNTPVSAPPGA